MICDRCLRDTRFLNGRIIDGERKLVCYECSREVDKEKPAWVKVAEGIPTAPDYKEEE